MTNNFRPSRISKSEMDEIIQECIEGVISPSADLVEMRWWLSYIPEALRYCYRKRKKIQRSIEQIEYKMEEIDAKFKLVYIHSSRATGNITEKKDFAESMKVARSPEYRELCNQHMMFTELLNNVDADIYNLQEKSTSIRKFSNIETSRIIYEDE